MALESLKSLSDDLCIVWTYIPLMGKLQKDTMIRWIGQLSRTGHSAVIKFNYSQGLGHLPGLDGLNPHLASTRHLEEQMLKTGRGARGAIHRPKLQDALYCLLMDAQASQYQDFEDWADNFGYDRDSRSAEKTYQACLSTARDLATLFTPAELERLGELFQDY